MTVYINGTTGYSGPIGAIGDLSTTGNTTLGDAAGDTLTINGSTTTFTQGTANGVLYLNGSKVATSGSALVFDGTNLGVGTTSPAVKLDVAGNATVQNGVLTIGKDTVYDAFINTPESMYFNVDSDGNSSNNKFTWGTDRAGTSGGTTWMTLDASGNLALGASSVPRGRLYVNSASSANCLAIQSSTTGVYLEFADSVTPTWTNSPKVGAISNDLLFSTGGSERMRIDSSGNVGIGGTPSSGKLHVIGDWVSGNSTVKAQTVTSLASGGTVGYGTFDSNGTRVGYLYSQSGFTAVGSSSSTPLILETAGAERARIDSSGRFAVGTTNITGGGFNPTIAAKSFVDSIGGGIMVEGSGADCTLSTGYDGTSMFISSSYRTTAGYKPIAFYTSGTERMRLTTAGDLLINATSNGYSASLLISANSGLRNAVVCQDTGTNYGTGYYYQWFVNSSGSTAGSIAHTASTTVAFQTSSDKRLKQNIVDAPSALEKVNDVKVCSFDWIEDGRHVDYGFIAQDLYKVIPEAVGKGDDAETLEDPKGTWQVEYGRLTPILFKAIQELKAEFDAYKLTHP